MGSALSCEGGMGGIGEGGREKREALGRRRRCLARSWGVSSRAWRGCVGTAPPPLVGSPSALPPELVFLFALGDPAPLCPSASVLLKPLSLLLSFLLHETSPVVVLTTAHIPLCTP